MSCMHLISYLLIVTIPTLYNLNDIIIQYIHVILLLSLYQNIAVHMSTHSIWCKYTVKAKMNQVTNAKHVNG